MVSATCARLALRVESDLELPRIEATKTGQDYMLFSETSICWTMPEIGRDADLAASTYALSVDITGRGDVPVAPRRTRQRKQCRRSQRRPERRDASLVLRALAAPLLAGLLRVVARRPRPWWDVAASAPLLFGAQRNDSCVGGHPAASVSELTCP